MFTTVKFRINQIDNLVPNLHIISILCYKVLQTALLNKLTCTQMLLEDL